MLQTDQACIGSIAAAIASSGMTHNRLCGHNLEGRPDLCTSRKQSDCHLLQEACVSSGLRTFHTIKADLPTERSMVLLATTEKGGTT